MRIDGRCHCGAITYEAELDPEKVRICNCTDCQTLSGSAFRTIAGVEPGSFRLLTGRPKEYTKIAESGRPRIQGFCPDCGTPIYSTAPGPDPKGYTIRVGTSRQRDQLAPKSAIWARSAPQWVRAILGDMPQVQTDH
jgi:hypothetical protein